MSDTEIKNQIAFLKEDNDRMTKDIEMYQKILGILVNVIEEERETLKTYKDMFEECHK